MLTPEKHERLFPREKDNKDEEPLYEVEFELDLNEYSMGDDDIESVKPYGDFSTDSPEKIGRVKNVGDKYQRKISKNSMIMN